MVTIIDIQDELIAKIEASADKWGVESHLNVARYPHGHYGRTRRAAKRLARRKLSDLGIGAADIDVIIKDAIDVAELQRRAL